MVNQDIGRKRTEIGHDNMENVFNAIRELSIYRDPKPKVRLEDIRNYLDKKTDYENKEIVSIMTGIYESGFRNWTHAQLNDAIRREKKKTISYRTIQRCITNDPRIKKQGWYYFIDDEARFEKRYLTPSSEGRCVYKEFRNNMSGYYYNKLNGNPPIEDEMKHLVTEIGFFMVYSLIDACRPFRDKSMSLDDREDLVRYWIQNSTPVLTMLDEFLVFFKPNYNPYDNQNDEGKRKGLSALEMDDETIRNVLTMLQEEYPTQFKIIAESVDPRGAKRMSPFAYKDGNLIHPKKEKMAR